jgi:hypothetical protein
MLYLGGQQKDAMMKSPFPGMDPYLEQHWRDVHASLVLYARDQIQPQLGGSLRARVEERVVVDVPASDEELVAYPDIRIISRGGSPKAISPRSGGVVVAEPLVIQQITEQPTEGFIEVLDRADNNRVVTVIEILSLTNKRPGPDRKTYRSKQREIANAGVNLVEIDLLRSGRWVFAYRKERVPIRRRGPYAASVRRGHERKRHEHFAMPLRERLPAIPIPLRETDPDVVLNIQALIEQAYTNGAYDDIDYARDPVPPLEGEDAAWANELLKAAGKR